MPTPDRPENGPPEPRPEPTPRPDPGPGSGSDPPGPHAQPWSWSVDPDPPTSEPTPDPEGGSTVDEPLPPPPVDKPVPPPVDGPAAGTGPPDPQAPVRPPDWSTPDTPVVAPPIGGDSTLPYPDQPPPYADQSQPDRPPDEQWQTEQRQTGQWPPEQPRSEQPPPDDWSPGQSVSWLDDPDAEPHPVRPERRRRLWLLLGVSVALVICCCAGVVGTALTWGGDIYTRVESRGQRVVGLNQAGRDGDLEFLVSGVRCGVDQVGDRLVNQAAVGQFCLVELAVRNIGKNPAFFTDALQRAYGPDGALFNADSEASLLANADQQAFLNEINPGILVTGALVYDIPVRARIVRLRLYHVPSSPGLVVRVE
ncbi:uncharacterized protein DUF4352 [Micromonospora pisi]|uniref:Uncharacterized protein DUF4352 n=1 Tax=Micromonospora pisi TaxID=589240 RepID=A0A495JKS4_9ACTN|nr:DUF4352 domain-containing protein [Micromonospora pisi]RKR89660.1 uncharacterized protein DUF4352 [Micromonospora pisi]